MLTCYKSLKNKLRKHSERKPLRWIHRKTGLESLEKREMLAAGNIFAEFTGLLNQSGDVENIPITIAPEKVGITGTAVLGFQTQSLAGENFDPAAIQIRRADGSLVKPEYSVADLAGKTDSVAVVELSAGNYTIDVSGVLKANSEYHVGVYLVGDVDGDHAVAQNDLDTIRQIYGAAAGDSRYQIAADANLDGRINAIDLSLARRNKISSQSTVSENATTEWGGVYDRIAAVTPTTGYDQDAPMQFFESQDGWMQPLASANSQQGGVCYVPVDPFVTINWFSRDTGYGDDLVIYQVDDANGTIDGVAPGDSGYAAAAASRLLATIDGEDSASISDPDRDNTLPTPHQTTVLLPANTYFSFYVVQGSYDDVPNAPHYTWFPYSAANVDGYQHFQEVPSSDPNYVAGATTFKVEDLSNNTTLYPNPGGLTNDADFNDIVFSVDVDPQLPFSGAASVKEGSEYTLTLSDVIDPDLGDVVTTVTIHWGDSSDPETYTLAQIAAAKHQLTHLYTDGSITPTISVDLTNGDGTYTGVYSKTIAVENVAPYLQISGSGSMYKGLSYTLNLSSSDPGNDTITSWAINWGDGQIESVAGNPSSVSHVYSEQGNYTISAMATDEDGTYTTGGDVSGVLDARFGTEGMTTTNVSVGSCQALATAVQSDGKTVVLVDAGDFNVHLVRYNANGTLDESFGTSGMVTSTLDGWNTVSAMAIQSDGRIVVVGSKNDDFLMVRYLTDGTLDASFGIAGETVTDLAGNADKATSVAIQSDGKIVVAGSSYNGNENDYAVVRYLADGTLDTDFGSNGKVITDIAANYDNAVAVAIRSDGMILVAGTTNNGSDQDFALVCYHADGSLNTGFGTNGKVTTDLTVGDNDYATTMVLQSDGKVVVAGYAYNGDNHDYALVRYNLDGSLDSAFGEEGVVFTDLGGREDQARSVAVLSDGKILVAGATDNGTDMDFALVRYNANGAVDTDFGTGGKITTILSGTDFAWDMALRPDGKIVVVGAAGTSMAVACYNADGSLNNDFATGGKRAETVAGGGNWDQAAGIAVQADDKIVAVGSTWSGNGDFAVVRYGADGSLDVSFGTAGKVTTDFAGSVDYASSVAIQSDGKIVVAGTSNNGSDDDFAVVRYNTDGTLDTSFGTAGKVTTDFAAKSDNAQSVVIQSDGKIVVAGYTTDGNDTNFAVVRYNADGTLDTSFGTGGKVITDIAGCNDQAYSVVLQSDGKIVVAGTSNNGSDDDFAVVRYNADGSLDNSFGSSGKTTTDLFGRADRARSVVLQSNGQIVVAGSTDNGANDDFAVARYNADGSLDTSFGGGGIAMTDFVDSFDEAYSVTIQSDGKILVAGQGSTASFTGFGMVRYNADGTVDTGFGANGRAATSINGLYDYATGMAVQSDGTIVLAGLTMRDWADADFAVVRYLPGAITQPVVVQSTGPSVSLTGTDTAPEKLPYTLTLGDVGNGYGEAETYTIHWGDGQSQTYTAAAIANLNRQIAHIYATPIDSTITVDLGYAEGTYSGVASKKITVIAPIFPSLSLYSSDLVTVNQSRDNRRLHLKDDSGELPTILGTANSNVGDNYLISGSVTFSTMTEMGLLARCNMADGTGYVLALDPTNSSFNLIKRTSPTTSSTLASHQVSGLIISNGETFKIALEVIGSTIAGKLFSSKGTLLDTITATDAAYATGSIGIWASKNVEPMEGIWSDMGLSCAVTSIVNSVNEGSPYTLDLSSNPRPNGNWTIDWGDGSDPDNDGIVGEIVAGSASSAIHVYADGNRDYTITTTADIITQDTGALDPTFGNSGTGILNVDGRVIATGTQSDGKIITLSRIYDQSRLCNDYCLARFTADGILDTSFGTNGKVVINYTLGDENGLDLSQKLEDAQCLVVQSDDKILIGGSTNGPSVDLNLAVVRFNANGSLDTSYGTNGFVNHDLSLFSVGDFSVHCSGINSTACNLALQSDGSIIVHGTKSRTMNGRLSQSVENVLTRYTDNGTLDNGFGINGLVSIGGDLNNSLPYTSSFIEISSDDKILVMEHIKDNGTFHLVRYNADGSLDSGFGTGGKVATDFVICDVAVQSDGKIVTGGWSSDDDNYIVSLARYNTDGTLDTSFGIDGRSNTDMIARNYALTRSNSVDLSIAIQNNGKILVTGGLIYDVTEIPNTPCYLARYNTDGSLDGCFGTNGITTTNFATGMNVSRGIIAEADGHVLIFADTIYYSNGFRNVLCTVSRYLPGHSDNYTISRTVTVNNVMPTITLGGASTAYEGNTYTLIMGSVVDPGQDTVTSYTIHWGDGTSTTYNTETPLPTSRLVTHTYAAGSSSPTITVDLADEDGTYSNVVSKSLTGSAMPIDENSVNEGSPYTLKLSNDLLFSNMTWTINWGDWGNGLSQNVSNVSSVTHIYADGPQQYSIDVQGTGWASKNQYERYGFFKTPGSRWSYATDSSAGGTCDSWIAGVLESMFPGHVCPNLEYASVEWQACGSDSSLLYNARRVSWYAEGDVAIPVYELQMTEHFHETAVVTNVAPTATLTNSGPVKEGSTATVSFGSQKDPSSVDIAAGLHYAFDLDNDGIWDVGDGTYANSSTDSSTIVAANYLTEGPGTRVVKGRIIDKDGECNDYTTTIVINNVAPTATFSNSGSVDEGSTATVSFSGQYDPSSLDTAAGFHYAFDFNNDGTWDNGDGTYDNSSDNSSATISASYFADNQSRIVKGRIIDKDGECNDYTTTIVVNNVAPTATFSNSGSVDEGSTATVSFSGQYDPSTPDIDAGFRYAFDFDNDGIWDVGSGTYAGSSTSASATVLARYLADGDGSREIKGRILDKDGNSTDYTTTITINNVAPTAALTNNGPVREDTSATVSFVNPKDPSTADVTAGFHYSFDVNHDGQWEYGDGTYEGSSSTASVPVDASYLSDPGTWDVIGRIIDKDGDYHNYTTTITVSNVIPLATLTNGGAVNEGSSGTVAFINPSDPNCHYAFDFDNDGIWDVGDGTYEGSPSTASSPVSANYLADGPSTRTVKGRIIDNVNTCSDYTTTITILGVAPTLTVVGNQTADAGQLLNVTDLGTFTDPGFSNTQANPATYETFSYSIDWGDETTLSCGIATIDVAGQPGVLTQGSFDGSHTYTDSGLYTVTVTLTDDDGDSDTKTFQVTVVPHISFALTDLDLLYNTSTLPETKTASDPTITGLAVQGSTPVVGARIQLDIDDNGVADAYTQTDSTGHFTYLPTDLTYGVHTIQARGVEWNAKADADLYSSWVSLTFTYQIGLPPAIAELELASDTGSSGTDAITSDPTLRGSIDTDGVSDGAVTICFDLNDDGIADEQTQANAVGHFLYRPTGLSSNANPITLQVCASWKDPATGNDLYGPWTSIEFTYYVTPTAPSLADLRLANDTGAFQNDNISGDDTLTGSLDANAAIQQNVTIEFVMNGNSVVDGTAVTDATGHFTFDPTNLPVGTNLITVRARSSVHDSVANTDIKGSWRSFTFTCYSASTPPAVTTLQLANDTGSSNSDKITTDPTLSGQIETASANVHVEFAIGEDNTIIGTALTYSSGHFTFQPTGLVPDADPITLRARTYQWDNIENAYTYSSWQSLTFTYVASAYVVPSISTLKLANTTGRVTYDQRPIVTDAKLTGKITGDNVAYLTVAFDDNNDGKAEGTATTDASGNFTYTPSALVADDYVVNAWVHAWDYTQNAFVDSEIKSISFCLEVAAHQAPTISELQLLSPISVGSNGTFITANTMIVGHIAVKESGVAIQYKHVGDDTLDGTTITDANGDFYFEPKYLPYGQVTVEARTVQWDETQGTYLLGAWQQITFNHQERASTTAVLAELELANQIGTLNGKPVVTDPTFTGNIHVQDNGSLEGITVEMDFTGDGVADQSTTTDVLGNFSITPEGLNDGLNTISIRTRKSDDLTNQVFVSDWTTANLSPFSFLYLKTPSIDDVTQSLDATTGMTQVTGHVTLSTSVTNVKVEFDKDGDSASEVYTTVDSTGHFTYQFASGNSSNLLYVRVRETVGGSSPLYGQWQAVMPNTDTLTAITSVSQMALAGTSVNGATNTSAISGQIAGKENLEQGTTVSVQFDINGDRYTATPDENGSFTFNPLYVSGLVTIAARTSENTGSVTRYSDWKYLRFYYTDDPNSVESQAQVAALAELDPTWQTNLGAASGTSSQAQNTAQATYDQAVQLAQTTHDTLVQQADAAYQAAIKAANAPYNTAITTAGQVFANDLASYTGDQTTADMADFVWPNAPTNQSLTIPDDSTQPQAPTNTPTYDGTEFNLAYSNEYRSLLVIAQTHYSQAKGDADKAFNDAKTSAEKTYNTSVQNASNDYSVEISAAKTAYENATKQNSLTRSSTDIKAAFKQSWDAAYTAYNNAKAASDKIFFEVMQQNRSSFYDAAGQAYTDHLARYNSIIQNVDTSRQNYEIQQEWLTYCKEGANYACDLDKASADAVQQQSYREAEALIIRDKAILTAQQKYDHDMADYNREDRNQKLLAQKTMEDAYAVAQLRYANRIAEAALEKADALAYAAHRQSDALAVAQVGLWQATASAKKQSMDHWSEANGRTAWTEYQLTLACNEVAYYNALGSLYLTRATAKANAIHDESVAVAENSKAHADAVADADYQWAIMRIEADYAFGIDTSKASRDQDYKTADACCEWQKIVTTKQELLSKAIADAVHSYSDADANAYKIKYVADVKAYCTLHSYEITAATSRAYNDAIAESKYSYYTALAAASKISALAQVDAKEAYSLALNDPLKQYELACNKAEKEHAETIADLAGVKETIYAQADKDFTDRILNSSTERDKQVAAAGKTRKVAEAQADETYAIGDGEDNLGETGLSYQRKCDNAAAKETFQNTVASNYVTIITNWDKARNTPWTNYQLALAKAEQSHRKDLGEAEVQYAIDAGGADVTWSVTIVRAEEDCAEAIAGAELIQSQDVADAIKLQGEEIAKERYEYAVAVANATTIHDKGVAAQNKTYYDKMASERQVWAKALDITEYAIDRSNCQAWYYYTCTTEEIARDYSLRTINDDEELLRRNNASHEYQYGTNGIVKMGIDADRAHANATKTHGDNVALARHDWVDAISNLDAVWTGSVTSKAVVLANEICNHTTDLATAQTNAAKLYATTVADAVKTENLANATANRIYSNDIAKADASYNTRYDTADSGYRTKSAETQGIYEVALYTSHAAVLLYAAKVSGTPLAAYQAAAAAADVAWAQACSLARNEHEQAMTIAYADQTTTINAAKLKQTADYANKDYANAESIAIAEHDWFISSDSAEADRQLALAKAAAIKAKNDIIAQSSYRNSQAVIQSKYAEDWADAELSWSKDIVKARADCSTAQADADETLRQSEHTNADNLAHYFADIQNNDNFNADVQALENARKAAIDLADYNRVGKIGDAQITLAGALGDSVIAQAQSIGTAGTDYATAMNTADTAYATAFAAAENTYAVDTAPLDSAYDYTDAMADRDLTTATGEADVTYQQKLGVANVNYAKSVATAEAGYQYAVASANATKAFVFAVSMGTNNARLQATEAATYAAWIQAMGSTFVDFQTASAQADANYANAQAVSTATASNDQAAADLAYTDAIAAPTESHAINTTAAEQQDMCNQVGRDNTHRSALATADAAHALADAQANSQRAVVLAQAEKTCQVAYSNAQMQYDAAPANDPNRGYNLNNARTVAETEQKTAIAKANHDLIVGFDLSENDHVSGQAEADLQWNNSVAEADKALAEGNATGAKSLSVALAGYDYSYTIALSTLSGNYDRAYTTAQIAEWNRETAAENQWNTQAASANADFITASYNQAASVTGNMVTAMIETNAPGIDWAQFQAGLATAKANWWAIAKSNYLQNAADANALADAYQTEVNTRYQTQSDATIAAAATQTETEATALKNRDINQAEAERLYNTTIAGLTETFVKARAQAAHSYADTLAEANHNDNTALQTKSAAERAANIAYSLGASVAEGKRDVSFAAADLAYAQTDGQADVTYTQNTQAAVKTYKTAEAEAYASLRINTAGLDAALEEQQADTYADAIAAFAAANATPWAAFEAEKADAAHTWQSAASAAMLTHETNLANYDKQLEIDTAAADELFANASATADLNSRAISATSDLLTATIKAAKQVGQAIYDAIWGNDLPEVAAVPETKASDLVSGITDGDYAIPSNATLSHYNLTYNLFCNPWGGSWHSDGCTSNWYNSYGWSGFWRGEHQSNWGYGWMFGWTGWTGGWQRYGNGTFLWGQYWNNWKDDLYRNGSNYWYNDRDAGLIRSTETGASWRSVASGLDISAILSSFKGSLSAVVLPKNEINYGSDYLTRLAKSATQVYSQFTGSTTLVDTDSGITPPYQTDQDKDLSKSQDTTGSILDETANQPPSAPDYSKYEVCFATGTLVLLANGIWKPIEKVQVGEFVLSASENDPEGNIEPKQVVQVYHNKPNQLLKLQVGDAVIRVTLPHPIYVHAKGWTQAKDLQPGDQVRSHEGQWLALTTGPQDDAVEPVYNLQIDGYHTYFVGQPTVGWSMLVHNDSASDGVTDTSKNTHIPSSARGSWIEGTERNGVFQYSDTPVNREKGLVGIKIRYCNGYIGLGAFPADAYYEGSAAAATVEIKIVKGTKADFTAADEEMRRIRKDPNWERPEGYTWNHAGEPGSKKMELLNTAIHEAVAHEGPASEPRALARIGGGMAKALAIGNVYMCLRDALQAAGVTQDDYVKVDATYYFLADDGSVFVVKCYDWPRSWISSPYIQYIAGPRKGQTEKITEQEVATYSEAAENVWGQYIPGTLFSEPRFKAGRQRERLPLIENGIPNGYIDENGVHRYRKLDPGIQGA